MSLVGTFAVMYLLGYSLDNLSLMALTLAVGFVVDDAIVVLENIVRHIEQGEPVMEAALNGSREISFTVISMTLSLVAVFIPVLFLGGLIGRLFQEFAVTIARGDPGLGLRLAHPHADALQPLAQARARAGAQHGRFYQVIERAWETSLAWYERSLGWVMDRRGAGDAVQPAASWSARWCWAGSCPRGSSRARTPSQLNGTTETAEGTSYDAMVQHQRAAAAIVQEDPNVDGFMSSVGAGGRSNSVNQGRLFIHLKPREPARRSSADAGGPVAHPQAGGGAGHAGLHHQPAGDQHRRPLVQEPVPVHPAELRHRGAVPRRRRAGAAAARRARAHRRHQRPADQEPAGPGQHRPRPGRGARHRREPDRERALQRVRRAPGQHHLHAERPVLGGDGAAAPVPARPLGR